LVTKRCLKGLCGKVLTQHQLPAEHPARAFGGQFTAALNQLPVNFPPGQLARDERFQNVAFNMSDGAGSLRGPWNEGQGPWPSGMEWDYVEKPTETWLGSDVRRNRGAESNPEGSPAVDSEKPFTHEQRSPST
jgi:Mn-containing catalase